MSAITRQLRGGTGARGEQLLTAAAVAAVAAWSVVVGAARFDYWHVSHLSVAIVALPIALGLLIAIGPRAMPRAVIVATVWSAVLAAALLVGPLIERKPSTALAIPAIGAAAALCARWPAVCTLAIVAATGFYNTILAFTSIQIYKFIDALMAGMFVAVIAALLTRRRQRPVRAWPGLSVFALYLILTAIEIPLARSLSIGRDSFHGSAWYMLVVVAVAYAPWGPATRRRMVRGLIVVAGLVGAYATLRLAIGSSHDERELVVADHGQYSVVNGKLVLFGSFPSGHHLSAWTCEIVPFCLGGALAWAGRWRIISLLSGVLCIVALLGSEVRAGVAAVALGLTVVVLLYQFARAFPGAHLGGTAAALGCVAGFVAAVLLLSPAGSSRYSNILDPGQDFSYQQRQLKWDEAWRQINRHPLGQGLGTSGQTAVSFERFVTLGTTDVDNSYLKIGLDQGLPGMILFTAGALLLLLMTARGAIALPSREEAGIAIGAVGTLAAFLVVIYTGVYIEGLTALAAWVAIGLGAASFVRGAGARTATEPASERAEPVPVPPSVPLPAPVPATPAAAEPARVSAAPSMRLLSVINNPVFGGGHNNLIRLAEPLARRGWETIAVGPAEPGATGMERARTAGIEVIEMPLHRLRATPRLGPHVGLVRGMRPEVEAIRRLIRERDIDLVQAHGPTNPHAAMAAHLEGVAVVWHIYDTRAPLALRAGTTRIVVRLADAATVIGHELVRAHPGLERLGDRLIVVLPPVVADDFAQTPERREAARTEMAVPAGALVVGTVGNRNPSKGHDHLVRAVAELRETHPDAVARVLGAPSPPHAAYEQGVREEARRLGLGEPETFSILDPGRRVPDLIGGFDVFALTSVPRSEGMPTVILEGMAAGLPVVATRVGAVAEVVEDGVTGFVVPPLDDRAMAAALARLAADPELRRRFGEEGRRRVLERYDIEALADEHARAYEIALEHRRRRA